MRLGGFEQVQINDLPEQADLFLAASGYEGRASFIASKLSALEAKEKVALGFANQKVLARSENDRVFAEEGFEIVEASGDESAEVINLVEEVCSASGSEETTKLIVDYTSMTRLWYAAVLLAVQRASWNCRRVQIDFIYAPSKYSEPHPPPPNTEITPIPGFSSLQLPTMEIALVVGLGYERDRATGLVEYIEPSGVYAFLSSPAVDQRFERDVRENNETLLRRLHPSKIVEYPLMDMETTASLLSSVALPLRDRYRLVLAPQGPKPFTLLSLMMSCIHERIDVWRVSGGYREKPYDRLANGNMLISRILFS